MKDLSGVTPEEMLKVVLACKNTHTHKYIHTYIHTYIYTSYIHTYINAYIHHPDEPVWAIGTGLVCPKEVAQEVSTVHPDLSICTHGF